MSLIARHGLLGLRFHSPVFVREQDTGGLSATTYSMTLSVTPVEGNLMVLALGGAQTRSYSSGLTGWGLVTGGSSGTTLIAYKVAGAGESTSISVTWSGNLQGSMQYYEFSDCDAVAIHTEHLQTAAVTSVTHTFSSAFPSVGIVSAATNNSSNTFSSITSGWDYLGTSRHVSAYKLIIPVVSDTVAVVWGTSATCQSKILLLRGRTI